MAEGRIVEVTDGQPALDHPGGALDDLLAATAAPVTARRPWLSCWARHHDDWLPWMITVWQAGVLRAAAVLARQSRRGVVRVVMLGRGQSDYAWLPVRESGDAVDLADAIHAALRGLHRPWVAHLDQLPLHDPVITALATRLRHHELEPGDPSQLASFAPGTDLRTAVTRSARATVRLAHNRLAREGVRLDVSRIRDVERVRALLPDIARLRVARDSAKGLRSDHADEAARGFWYEVLPMLAGRGELEIILVRLDDRLAAYAVILLDPPAYRVWDTRIDPDLRVYSPGHLLRDAMLGWLHTEPCWSELDMMRGTEPYKNAATPQIRATTSFRAWSSSLLWLPHRARRTAAAVRDRHPAMVRLDRTVRRAQVR